MEKGIRLVTMHKYLLLTTTKPGHHTSELWYYRDRLEKFITSRGGKHAIFEFQKINWTNGKAQWTEQFFVLGTTIELQVILDGFPDWFGLIHQFSPELSEVTEKYRHAILMAMEPPRFVDEQVFIHY